MNSSLTPLSRPSCGRLSCRARACCSDKMFMAAAAFAYTNTVAETTALSTGEPRPRPVLCGRDLRGAAEGVWLQHFAFKPIAKNLREIFAESRRQIAPLDAALVQESGPRSAMGS